MEKLPKLQKLSKSKDPFAVPDFAVLPECQHFKVGTFVVYNRERCEVLAVHEGLGVMAIRYPDETCELIQPYCLQRRYR